MLPLVAGSERFQRLVRARTSEEEQSTQQAKKELETSEMLEHMSETECQRFYGLQGLAGEIRQNYKGFDSSSRMLLDELVQKLDFLLSFYLRMRCRCIATSATSPPGPASDPGADRHARPRGRQARTRAADQCRSSRSWRSGWSGTEGPENGSWEPDGDGGEVLQLLRDQSYAMRDP